MQQHTPSVGPSGRGACAHAGLAFLIAACAPGVTDHSGTARRPADAGDPDRPAPTEGEGEAEGARPPDLGPPPVRLDGGRRPGECPARPECLWFAELFCDCCGGNQACYAAACDWAIGCQDNVFWDRCSRHCKGGDQSPGSCAGLSSCEGGGCCGINGPNCERATCGGF